MFTAPGFHKYLNIMHLHDCPEFLRLPRESKKAFSKSWQCFSSLERRSLRRMNAQYCTQRQRLQGQCLL